MRGTEPALRPLVGLIEGFYGRTWTMEARERWAGWLRALCLDGYLYAPKADPFLRKRWGEEPPRAWHRDLRRLSAHFRHQDVRWGPGLSPFALYRRYGDAERRLLERRVRELNALDGAWLAILFDDMPGDCPDLAERQCAIVRDVLDWSCAERLFVCPTYYSDDPVLDRVFGQRPPRYLATLGESLPKEVDVFWTGREICAEAITAADLVEVQQALARPVAIWDNHPVNDSRQRCERLFLEPARDRDASLPGTVRGHFANAMNQPTLSLPAVAGLSMLYGRRDAPTLQGTLRALLGEDLWRLLDRDRCRFETLRLGELTVSERETLLADYGAIGGPGAAEVVAWLSGAYAFDPECLTD